MTDMPDVSTSSCQQSLLDRLGDSVVRQRAAVRAGDVDQLRVEQTESRALTETLSVPASVTVIGGKLARVGDPVYHFGQRFSGATQGTATVVGFGTTDGGRPTVRVKPFGLAHGYGTEWDADRTLIGHGHQAETGE